MKKLIKRILNWGSPEKYVRKLHENKSYLDAYADHTDTRVAEGDVEKAIGGSWEEMGKLQFDFLVKKGLEPQHKMLDIGCGTLRGGRHFIKHLGSKGYTGFDISAKAIEHGKKLVEKEGLSDKKPELLISKDKNLKFKEFNGREFDFIFAQSVLTHLPPESIEELFENIGNIMNQESVFYFTYFEGDRYEHFSIEDFRYPFSHFESVACDHGFTIENCSHEYQHKIGQKMAAVKKKTEE
ncbi:hypothetical protein CL629_04490 [bacterium]|nr:hypothetical protein [bacterium]|tara:strand:- start:6223 stop:6939 length:717 start_codon:yes stop_codon:yes gene_type:complete